MISIVRNGVIILSPQICPETWTDPDTGTQWSNFRNFSIADLDDLGRKDVVDNPMVYDPMYEELLISDWSYYEIGDVVTRTYAVVSRGLETVREERLVAVRSACNQGILAVIDIYQQMNLANGLLLDLGYTEWIAKMIKESNRCERLYEASTDMAGLQAVVWNFPAYIYP